jgi:uncharacterized membrane protein
MTIENIIIVLSVLLLALITGLFYGYSCSVNGGLGRLSDAEYLRAMQSINRAILNPVFFASFLGTLIMLPVYTWICYGKGNDFYFALAGCIIYTLFVFGLTMTGNVPLNNILDRLKISSSTEEVISKERESFEKRWNTYHQVRTVSCVIALILILISIIN